jgi:hypothetical protein
VAKRVCAEPGCPTLTTTPRCPIHTRARDRARGTRQARGYDAAHDATRAMWQARIDAGKPITCWRPDCTTVLTGRAWHLGHDDHDRGITRGPECIPCNLRHAGMSKPR